MKKVFAFLLLSVSLFSTTPVLAESKYQEPIPTNSPPSEGPSDEFLFSQLGFTETRLMGPFSTTGLEVSFPEEWVFEQSALLHLEYSLSMYGADIVEGINRAGGVLNISVNNSSLTSIPLNSIGEYSVDIPIGSEYLLSQQDDGRFEISFDLVSQESCIRDIEVDIVIRESSYLKLPHTSTTPLIDLTLFPRPFYQPDSLYERKLLLVVPDNASESELQAAMDVSAGLGNLTNGNLLIDLVRFSNLTTDLINSENLVLIGKPGSIPMFSDLDMPVKLVDGLFDYTAAGPEDGLIQEIISPKNDAKVILIVSGNTDKGVVKSGQAVKSGEILIAGRNDVSFVQDFRPQKLDVSQAIDQSFKDLGYDDRTVSYLGTSSVYIDFYISPQSQVDSDASLNLHFNHSPILSYDASGMTVLLNGRIVSSVQFKESTTQPTEIEINLPPSAFLTGPNQLVIQVRLVPIDNCSEIGFFYSSWATIFSDTSLHLPVLRENASQPLDINLRSYPRGVMTGSNLGMLTFILDTESENSLKVASAISYDLGNRVGNILNQIKILDAKLENQDKFAEDNVIIIGRPANTPLIFDIKETLPAPFEIGSEVPIDPSSKVVFRVMPGSEVGYLEMFESPWNANNLAILVSGNSNFGLDLAEKALSGGDFQGNLSGNFAIISSGRIISLDTKFKIDSELLDTQDQTTQVNVTQSGIPQVEIADRGWMIPAIIAVSVITMIVILIALLAAVRKSKFTK